MADDPYTTVFDKIWTTISTHAAVMALVSVGNRISLSGSDPAPKKPSKLTSDVPEIILEPFSHEANLWATSHTSDVLQTMVLTCDTGDQRIDQVLYPLLWAVTKALYPLKDGLVSGINYLTGVVVTGVDEEIATETVTGLRALMTIQCRLSITNSMMTA